MLLLLSLAAVADPIPAGPAERTVTVGDHKLKVFTYRPKGKADGPLLLVFHGVDRNADTYRDHAKPLADKLGATVAAPLFPKADFPSDLYPHGGVWKDGKPRPRDEWSFTLVPKLAAELRRSGQPYFLIGHSAGGQFVHRLAAFTDTEAGRVVAANPGTLLFPTLDAPYPYGFGKLPDDLGGEAALKRYLAQPLTLFLGTADTKQDKNFSRGEWPDKQGDSRHARGSAAFAAGKKLAAEKGWPFRWRKVEAPGVGHSGGGMFGHANCLAALAVDTK